MANLRLTIPETEPENYNKACDQQTRQFVKYQGHPIKSKRMYGNSSFIAGTFHYSQADLANFLDFLKIFITYSLRIKGTAALYPVIYSY